VIFLVIAEGSYAIEMLFVVKPSGHTIGLSRTWNRPIRRYPIPAIRTSGAY